MDAVLRKRVRERAADRCEYCLMPQGAVHTRLQIEHIVAQQHLGSDEDSNLALACDLCNRYKGPNLSAIDPETGTVVRLFHPREDAWEEHFAMQGARIVGLTAKGRATLRLLLFNSPRRLQFRALLMATGGW